MSKAEDLRYQIERERRQRLFEERVRQTTREYQSRHTEVLDRLEEAGLSSYVAHEFSRARQALARVDHLLRDDPAAARDLSVRTGAEIRGLPALAREAFQAARLAQQRFEAGREQREQAASQAMEETWRAALAQWDDDLARQLARPALAALRRDMLAQDGRRPAAADLAAAVARIRAEAGAEADRVREVAKAQAEAESRAALLADLGAVGRHAEDLAAGQSLGELAGQLALAVADADEAAVSEQARREVVSAVSEALLDAGFITEKPRRIRADGLDEVVLRATRPSGAEAAFRIGLGGVMHYEFDKYEGTACRKDIDQVLPTLQSVYGIQLSDRRVVWENPDDLDQDARPLPPSNRSSDHG